MDISLSALDQDFSSPNPENAMPPLHCAIELATGGWRTFPMTGRKTPIKGSRGVHLIFRHRPEIRTTVLGKIGKGVEIRATGASAIYWPAQGFPYLCEGPIAAWPDWLLPPPPAAYSFSTRRVPDDRQITALIRVAATARESHRNQSLFWCACRMAEMVASRLLSAREAESLLIEAGSRAGLPEAEARATARSGLRTGGAA